MSPVFEDLLKIVGRYRGSGRLNRIVLTTNGCAEGLSKHLDSLANAITHINISRHAADDYMNARIFKTEEVPSATELKCLISELNKRGLPVNLNCVYSTVHVFGRKYYHASQNILKAEAMEFISFAKGVGASSVVFRLDHRENALDQGIELEEAFADYKTVHQAKCDSCRVIGKFICGLSINFKRSVYEPVKFHPENELYELVLHSDAVLYKDWSRHHPLERPLPQTLPTADWELLITKVDRNQTNPAKECDEQQKTCTLMTVR